MSRTIFDPKTVAELKTVQFNFSSQLAVSETITSALVAATVYAGTDPLPSNIVSGGAATSGAIVNQNITDGIVGVTYTLVCTIITSNTQTLTMSAFLTIIPPIT